MTTLRNPLIPGFNPDPSIVAIDGVYYLATSTFEYVPGIPIYRSTDLETWTRIGNVITTPEQAGLGEVPTNGGVWAPTIRHRDGRFHVIVTIAMGLGCMVYTAVDPAGPWTGVRIEGIEGIDPDLAWDEDGTAIVTYSGLVTTGPDVGHHGGIRQVDVDLATGAVLAGPRDLWSGGGGIFPEAPHLYRREDVWYLMIAEGGTERGHGVSIARSAAARGPFEPGPANPILTARSTDRPIQNTGHGDLVETPEGTVMVLLGVRPRGATRAFSALGRETFATRVHWGEDGWPTADPVLLNPRSATTEEVWDYAAPLDPGWIAVRRAPAEIVDPATTPDALVLRADGSTLGDLVPVFLGRRQLTPSMSATVVVDAVRGAGGIAVRYDEENVYSISARGDGDGTVVTAQARVPGIAQSWTGEFPAGPIELELRSVRPEGAVFVHLLTSDLVELVVRHDGTETVLASVDARYLSAETAASFTGRVLGVFATAGEVVFSPIRYRGSED